MHALQVSAGCLPDDKAALEVCRRLAKMLGNPVRSGPKDAFRALIGATLLCWVSARWTGICMDYNLWVRTFSTLDKMLVLIFPKKDKTVSRCH